MSILWGYDPRKCDGEFCPNDCDRCYKGELVIEDDDTSESKDDDN